MMFRNVLTASLLLIVVFLGAWLYWIYGQKSISLVIVSPLPFQTFQRSWESNTASIPLTLETTGYSQGALSVDIQWLDRHYTIELSKTANPCETVFAAMSGLSSCVQYTGQIENLSVGRGNLMISLSGQTAIVDSFGVGDVIVLAGQSNAVGFATNPQAYSPVNGISASMFTLRGDWMQLDDHILADSRLSGQPMNSHWPLLASMITDYTGVPVAFIPTAHGAVAIDAWSSTGVLNRIVRQQIIDSETYPLIILWHQGESDVINQTPQDRYYNLLIDIANRWHEEFKVSILAANLGPLQRDTVFPENLQAIRAAIVQAWEDSPYIYPGADMSDVARLRDGAHFRTNEESQLLADRWFQALIAFGLPSQ